MIPTRASSRLAYLAAIAAVASASCVVRTQPRRQAPPPPAQRSADHRSADARKAPAARDHRRGSRAPAKPQPPEGVTTEGDATAVEAPRSLVPGGSEIDHKLQVFEERRDYELPRALVVDVAVPGEHKKKKHLGRAEVPAGTVLSSYYVHYDPVGKPDGQNSSGAVTFEQPIVGVISREKSMDASFEALGLSERRTEYPHRGEGHGEFALELGGQDWFAISPDRKRLTVSTTTFRSTDSVRVITSPTLGAAPQGGSGELAPGAGFTVIDPPPSVIPNQSEKNHAVQVFLERSGYELAADLEVDAAGPGDYAKPDDLQSSTLPAGTKVTSYYLHYDQVGTSNKDTSGWVTFPKRIVGVIAGEKSLDQSREALEVDSLPTEYPKKGQGHGRFAVDVHNVDRFSIGPDGKTLSVKLRASRKTDSFRVLTAE